MGAGNAEGGINAPSIQQLCETFSAGRHVISRVASCLSGNTTRRLVSLP